LGSGFTSSQNLKRRNERDKEPSPDTKEVNNMGELFILLFWTGPIGIGIFLMGPGVLFWGIGQVNKKKDK
jgi:hypothetical protein